MQFYAESQIRYNSYTNQTQCIPVVGIRSQLWNDYRNF
jgi:hypothetical protein